MIESHTDQNAGSCFSVINVAISFCSCFAIMINKGVSMFQLSSNWVCLTFVLTMNFIYLRGIDGHGHYETKMVSFKRRPVYKTTK